MSSRRRTSSSTTKQRSAASRGAGRPSFFNYLKSRFLEAGSSVLNTSLRALAAGETKAGQSEAKNQNRGRLGSLPPPPDDPPGANIDTLVETTATGCNTCAADGDLVLNQGY